MDQETVITKIHHCIIVVSCSIERNGSPRQKTMPIDPVGLGTLTKSAESEKGIYETLKHSFRSFSSLTTIP